MMGYVLLQYVSSALPSQLVSQLEPWYLWSCAGSCLWLIMFGFEVASLWGSLLVIVAGLWWPLYQAAMLLQTPASAALLSKSLTASVFIGAFFSLYFGWLCGEWAGRGAGV